MLYFWLALVLEQPPFFVIPTLWYNFKLFLGKIDVVNVWFIEGIDLSRPSLRTDCLEDDDCYHCPCCDYINANYNNFKGHWRLLHSHGELNINCTVSRIFVT